MEGDRRELRRLLDAADRKGIHIEKPVSLLRRYKIANAIVCGRIAKAIARLQGAGNER
jgi:hypothetical protein